MDQQTLPTTAPAVGAVAFDPKEHLIYKDTPATHTMREIGQREDIGISRVAVTEPFALFSPAAIQIMRSEIAQPEVVQKHSFSSNIAANQLRGYARDYAPFTYAAWNHPETAAIVSKLAGIELVPWGDYEIAHINLSSKSQQQVEAELKEFHQAEHDADEGIEVHVKEKPIVGWHKDSYPFVCVLMMSDVTGMIGGETALRTANNEVIKVRGPSQGSAVILQGRYITHQALRAVGAKERITAVTSWRPRSPFTRDDSELRTVRGISDLSELYYDFAQYRLEILEARIRHSAEEMRAHRREGKKFNTTNHKTLLKDLYEFLKHTDDEIVEEEQVQKGAVEGEEDIPDV
ncbi:hypothetical protein PtrSN002B_001888 [Pyrenophora tritici-repentis]|uniref:Uncharacterized protein n=2 Tax=Pyrenophora tritici-repentis TaxID=45151 RepID=A0A2W1EZI6_9PLEO|nr:uncharacterized protein PTRG_02887 [Pyrenophora tritici-repentis Pt-1C-BFP]KAA8623034.1 hypothetical protein PtrV1_04340 [Pyrenophora tritici-repentis]EDU45410.1 conserved hypothetical protein [Pyrenophora tritici-repentis Pt-1C-BFP]KAF7452025.1 hypothetical protein A1F99_038020 [Pyrenophora tritici-repentis]KAF7574855.1 hypothetical protein PtrM4_064790 [Pyrenophora tritici-repentis]KAG9386380.1 hypothetical protein A1F94_003130 [Pyrenophora tritici-repentis]